MNEFEVRVKMCVQMGKTRESAEYEELKKEAKRLGQPALDLLNKHYPKPSKPAPAPAQKQQTSGELLHELEEKTRWEDFKKAAQILEKLSKQYPEKMADAGERLRKGHLYAKYLFTAEELAYAEVSQKKWKEFLGKIYKNPKLTPFIDQIKTKYQNRKQAVKRGQEAQQIPDVPMVHSANKLDTGVPLEKSIRRGRQFRVHSNFLADLEPAESWTILIDETGKYFDEEVFSSQTRDIQKGRCVALLVPNTSPLDDLPLVHSADDSLSSIQKRVQTMLDSPCGVLGIPVESLNKTPGELWLPCIEALAEVILRLLPLNGKTKLEFFVENRGDFKPADTKILQAMLASCLYQFSKVFPERAELISVEGAFIHKKDHPWNGYVDTAAYLWGSGSMRQLLKNTGWLDTCFLGTKPKQLRNLLDFFLGTEAALSPEDWSELLSITSEGKENPSIIARLLDIQGEEARKNSELWLEYLQFVQEHLYSRSINLGHLSKQVNWLKTYQPDQCELPPRVRLLWLTTQLAEANHRGDVEFFKGYWEEFEDLCKILYWEDAPLVCQANLHIAVQCMDNLDFRNAYRVMERWHNCDMAIPGRQFYGQTLSTFGQICAFCRMYDDAIVWFDRAIAEFEKLSIAKEALGNATQTRAYKIIAMMDSERVTDEEILAEMEKYYGIAPELAAAKLPVETDAKFSYGHHILLRYIAIRGNEKLWAIYAAQKEEWEEGKDHPWELIEFYRGIMLQDAAESLSHLRLGYQNAMAGDGILHLIGCMILGGIYFFDRSVKEELKSLTERMCQEFSLSQDVQEALRNQLEEPLTPLEFSRNVLTFNFR